MKGHISNSELGRAAKQPPSLSSHGDNVVQQVATTEECKDSINDKDAMYLLNNKRKNDNDCISPKRNTSKKSSRNYNTLNINQTFNNRYQQSQINTASNKAHPSSKVSYTPQPNINDTDVFPSLIEPKPFVNDFPPWQVLSAIHENEDPDNSQDLFPNNFKYENMFNLVKELRSKINIVFEHGDIKRLYNGNVVFKVHTKAQYQSAKKIKEIMGIPCNITPHKFFNSSKGVVYSPYFKGQTAESLRESLSSEGILEVKKIMIYRKIERKSGENDMETDQPTHKQIDTGKAILTFDNINRPDKVWLGFCYAKVEMYIPPPLRCNKCQGYGHHSMACKNKQFCAKCDSQEHVDTKINKCPSNYLKCHNCHGKHASFSSECKLYKKAKHITTIKYKSNITWKQAIDTVENDPEWAKIKPINHKQTAPTSGAVPAATDDVADNSSSLPPTSPITSIPSPSPPLSPTSTSLVSILTSSSPSTSSSFSSSKISIPSSTSFTTSPSIQPPNIPPSSHPPSSTTPTQSSTSTTPSSNSSSNSIQNSKPNDRKALLSKERTDTVKIKNKSIAKITPPT